MLLLTEKWIILHIECLCMHILSFIWSSSKLYHQNVLINLVTISISTLLTLFLLWTASHSWPQDPLWLPEESGQPIFTVIITASTSVYSSPATKQTDTRVFNSCILPLKVWAYHQCFGVITSIRLEKKDKRHGRREKKKGPDMIQPSEQGSLR